MYLYEYSSFFVVSIANQCFILHSRGMLILSMIRVIYDSYAFPLPPFYKCPYAKLLNFFISSASQQFALSAGHRAGSRLRPALPHLLQSLPISAVISDATCKVEAETADILAQEQAPFGEGNDPHWGTLTWGA